MQSLQYLFRHFGFHSLDLLVHKFSQRRHRHVLLILSPISDDYYIASYLCDSDPEKMIEGHFLLDLPQLATKLCRHGRLPRYFKLLVGSMPIPKVRPDAFVIRQCFG